jgi:hypothetical protein
VAYIDDYYYAKIKQDEWAGHTVCKEGIRNELFSKMKGIEY